MYRLTEYVVQLAIILFCTDITWSIDIPEIRSLREIRPKKREDKTLQCNAVGLVKWTYNGAPLIANDHYELLNGNSILNIKDSTTNDSGTYRCMASNKYGMIFKEITLRLVGIGEFEDGYTYYDPLRTRNVTLGKPYELTCPPHTELPGQEYKWAVPVFEFWETGIPIPRIFQSDNHGSLYFSYITKDDIELLNKKGGIACLLYTDYQQNTPSLKIKLRGVGKEYTKNIAPKIVVPLKDTTAVTGESKTIVCGATGKPHPRFIWYKDGKLISTDDPEKSTVDNIFFEGKGIKLFISTVRADNAGDYKCVANNSEGEVTTQGTLTVNSKVEITTPLNRANYVPVKNSVTLECSATGIPAPSYIWYHNSSIVGSNSRRIIKGGRLHIAKSDFTDVGMYLCVAENKINTEVTAGYLVIQDVAPVITKGLLSTTYYFYHGAKEKTMTCEATGGPEPTISWYKDETLIQNGKHLTVKPDETLVFKDLTKDQDGVYKCVAKNRKSEASSSGTVKVFVRTLITKHPIDVSYPAGRAAYLFCDATVDETLTDTWQWLKDGKVIVYNDKVYLKDSKRMKKLKKQSHTLKIENLEADDGGVYTCKVFAKDAATFYSSDSANGSITVIMPPLPVGNVKITGAFDKDKKTDVTLSWSEPNKFVGPAAKYIIEYAKANSSEWTQYDPPTKFQPTNVKLDKDKLPASSDVVFRVKAVSTYQGKEMIGDPSEPTEPGTLVTPSRAPVAQPVNVRLQMEDEDGNATLFVWDKLKEVDMPGPGFEVDVSYREKGSNEPFTNVKSDGDSSSAKGPDVSDAGEDKEYEVIVKTKNDAGPGPTKTINLSVPGKKVSEQVKNVKLESTTTNGVSVTWTGVTGATGYRVFYTKKDSRRRRNTQTYKDVVGTQVEITDLKPGTQYEIFVAAKNLKGLGPLSESLLVDTKNGVPGVPDGVSIDTYADKVKLSWPTQNDPNIKNYTVSWYPKNDPTNKKTMTIPADEQEAFIKDSLDPDTYYTIELTANSDEGSGKPWVVEGVVVGDADKPGKPAPPLAVAINETMINVTFNLPVTNFGGLPDSFQICYPDGRSDRCFSSSYPDKPFIALGSLDYMTTYEFFSIAENSNGRGEKSDSVKQKPLDPPTTTPIPTTTQPTTTVNTTDTPFLVIVDKDKSIQNDEKAFYEELWFIILLVILIILIIIAIILCIICNRRGGRYPVGEKEKNYGGWDKDPLKDYEDDSSLENGVGVPLV